MKKCFWMMPLAVIFGLALALTACESDAGETTPVIPVNPTPTPVVTDWKTVPLTLEFIDAGKIQVERAPNGFQYTVNGGLMQNYTAPITGNTGDKVCFFAAGTGSGSGSTNYLRIISPDTKCYVYGNVMSLVNKTDYATATRLNDNYVFKGLFFENTFLTSHPTNQLVLPATTLSNYCYQDMFSGCTGLTTAPELPAETLTVGCYKAMFKGCTGLTKAPELPAASLTTDSYDDMFYGCSNLNYIKCLLTTPSFSDSGYWVKDVAAKGTFVKARDSIWSTSVDGIPVGWEDVKEEKVDRQSGTIKFEKTHIEKDLVGVTFTNELTKDGNGPVTYESNNPSVATVDASTGEVTTVGQGEATIKATVSDTATWEYEVKTATYELKVTSSQKTGSISYVTKSLSKKTTDAAFTNPISNTGNGPVTYESDNKSVAEVDASTGEVTLKGAAGTAVITATVADTVAYTYGTKNTAQYTITVKKPASISFTEASVEKATIEEPFTITAKNTGDAGVYYTSSNEKVATVDISTGKVTIVGEGTTTITASVVNSPTWSYEPDTASYTLKVIVDWKAMPFTVKFVDSTQLHFVSFELPQGKTAEEVGLQKSIDGGKTWADMVMDNNGKMSYGSQNSIPLSFRAKTTGSSENSSLRIWCDGECYISGNVMSLLGYRTPTELKTYTEVPDYAFYKLFDNVSNDNPFGYNNNIKIADKEPLVLPATTLGKSCYNRMFYRCTVLAKAPELPAETMSQSCYEEMFYGCTSLTTAPALPATKLAAYCYKNMFGECTSLVNAPALTVETLARNCYESMFANCSALTTAPDLPAKELVTECYFMMFNGCNNLASIKCLATDIGTINTTDWMRDVAATGTFTKAASMTGWPTGTNGIPSGWTVKDE